MAQRDLNSSLYIKEARPRFEQMLAELVELPSVSSDPQHADNVRRTAKLAVQLLRRFGAEAHIVETAGYPAVSVGWVAGNHYPTVTIYNHLDVQPAQEPEWQQPPFTFRNQGGRYGGRGTTDDKGPALTALLAGRYVVEQGLPINIRFLWELEEEIGSPHFPEVVRHTDRVPRPDSVLVSDTIWVAKNRPAIPCGLRGLLAARLRLRTGGTDVHSGLTGGGARNPLAELCDIAHACVDARSGRVKIPGFYDDVVPPTRQEMKEFLSSGFLVNRFKQAFKLRSLRTEDCADLIKRIWASPTFEVHRLIGGHTGAGVKTIVPAWGELKVSMRLVPNQRPEKILHLLRRFVKQQDPDIRVEPEGKLDPFQGVASGPYTEALRRAVRAGFGKDPVQIREGGSIGAVAVLQRNWRVPILFMGLSLPEHGYHAPNEFFDWGQASGGIRAFVHYFTELAHMGQPARGIRTLRNKRVVAR